ncbi:MAG: hypothetical protein AAFX04_03775 [Pseudomonadota bacterium]
MDRQINDNTDSDAVTAKSIAQPDPASADYYVGNIMLDGLSPLERRLLLAFRFAIMAGKRDLDGVRMLQMRTGSLETAIQMNRLVRRLGDHWEGPFMIAPPCYQQLTVDEAVVAQMLRAAMANDRTAFNTALQPMFNDPVITGFWWVTRAIARAALDAVS